MAGLLSEEAFEKFVAGGLAGAVAKSTIAPLDRVKVLFQATTRIFSLQNGLGESHRIMSQEGFAAFWKGNCAQLLRITPYTAIVRLYLAIFRVRLLQAETAASRRIESSYYVQQLPARVLRRCYCCDLHLPLRSR